MGGLGGSPPRELWKKPFWGCARALSVPFRVPAAVCLRGGNCNNGSKCGARCLNANNVAARANWNIGGSPSYPFNWGDCAPNADTSAYVIIRMDARASIHSAV